MKYSTTTIKEHMAQAATEENDHLGWCETRLYELGGHTSVFNPLWYSGAMIIGAVAGVFGDSYSLGFVVETENQVSIHLQKHLAIVPKHDCRTLKILETMRVDEMRHAEIAMNAGGSPLPRSVKYIMYCTSKLMTKLSYYL